MNHPQSIKLNSLDFSKGDGLLPVIIQDAVTLQVLMQAYMNREACEQTIRTRRVTFFSRSKKRLWTKGETSGNYLYVEEIFSDCDNDCLLIKVSAAGPACHTGRVSCFFNQLTSAFT
jgi:phosphoribosyl-AMP cyclohydrolase / phosphoribosyl-ATP pyrophosphohydrolase